MFCPRLLRNAAIYSYNRINGPDYEVWPVEDPEDANEIQRKYGITASLPYSLKIYRAADTALYPFLNNVEVGAYSQVSVNMEPSSVYCKLGEFSRLEIDGSLDADISPYRCIAVVGGDFCRVNVHISSYGHFYRNRPASDNPRCSIKERVAPAVTGIALKGGSFSVYFDISPSSISMCIQKNTEDLYVYHQGELVAVIPPGMVVSKYMYPDNKWKWELRKDIKKFLKGNKDA